MIPFRERAFLIKCLAGIFAIQFVYVGYQAYGCRSAVLQSSEETEGQINQICSDASRNFLEVGKMAIPTIIALLVKSAPDDSELSKEVNREASAKKKKEEEPSPEPLW